jgi:3-oxoacyl-[acyl-carrier protein] reductase
MNLAVDPKTVIISGGSRGLGLALVRHCLGLGHSVATFARSETEAVRELCAKWPDQFYFAPLDARDAGGAAQFVSDVTKRFNGLDGLVNNAAIGQDHLLVSLPPDLAADILDVNLKGPILLTRSVVRQMLLRGRGGRIVNVTSICGSQGYAGLTVYSATKGALEAFTRSLAREVGSRGILVNSIAPGFFLSEMSSVLAAAQIDTIRRRTPTERLVGEKDVLPVLDLLLFGDINLTGQVLHVDGGLTS